MNGHALQSSKCPYIGTFYIGHDLPGQSDY